MAREGKINRSVGLRLTVLIILMIAAISGVMMITGYSIFKNSTEQYYIEMGEMLANIAIRVIDADAVDSWLETRTIDEAYKNTMHLLQNIRGNKVKNLYAYQAGDDGSYFLFDAALDDEDPLELGYLDPFDPNYPEFRRQVLAGGKVDPVIGMTEYGWIINVNVPFYGSDGSTKGYVGVDFSMDTVMAERMAYLRNLAIIMLTITAALAALYLFIIRKTIILPVDIMAKAADSFLVKEAAGRESVGSSDILSMEINTNDELQSLAEAMKSMVRKINEYLANLNIATKNALQSENANIAKGEFLSKMSHEMRTPLNAIIGLSELELGSEELQGDSYNNVEKIYVSGMTLLGIINDILDISKIESGKFTLAPANYELPSLINDTVTQNMVRIGSRPVEFKLHIDETLPFCVNGDELRVRQIFNNLLSNAFKYTQEGSVDWYLSGEIDGDSVWLTSRVQDTGIGIRKEDIKRLFTDYNQVDLESNRRIEGTGLGLSITKNLVELMDGEISVESVYEKGSVFSIRIRQRYINDMVIGGEILRNLSEFHYTADRRSKKINLVRAYLPYAHVLVVDDVQTNLDVAKGMMKPYGMIVDCVNSGQKAIDIIREGSREGGKKYNAVFMDHMMPEIDGFEAVRIIRNEIAGEYAKTVPIIALTANAILGNEERFLKNGFQAFLSKPIDIIRLDKIINQYVRDRKLERELALPEKIPDSGGEPRTGTADGLFEGKTVAGIDFSTGLSRFSNDGETYLDILNSYLSQIRAAPDKIRTCTAAGIQDYRTLMHSLKGTSYAIGAKAIGKLTEELEYAAADGDLAFINIRSRELAESLEKLGQSLADFLETTKIENRKPVQSAPDPALLAKVLEASIRYDMGQLDAAMEELEQYDYETQSDLIEWLRKQADKSELDRIRDRLSKK
ncbi:MAG: response regulator [Treponema sp.]|nr:response regulator [Treponema sp.]